METREGDLARRAAGKRGSHPSTCGNIKFLTYTRKRGRRMTCFD